MAELLKPANANLGFPTQKRPEYQPELQDVEDAEIVDVEEVPIIKTPKKRSSPSGISGNVKQAVLLTCDSSGSMYNDKIRELNQAIQGLHGELIVPENRDGFFTGLISFDSTPSLKQELKLATAITFPQLLANGGTNFEAALELSRVTLEQFNQRPNTEGWFYLRPQVLFLSDGHSSATDETIAALQEVATVQCVAYGDDADLEMLSKISSDGHVHQVGIHGGELRAFLAEVGKTLSKGYQAGKNA